MKCVYGDHCFYGQKMELLQLAAGWWLFWVVFILLWDCLFLHLCLFNWSQRLASWCNCSFICHLSSLRLIGLLWDLRQFPHQDLERFPPPSSPAMICSLVFHWILCFGWVCLLPCVCADWEGTAFFPSRLFHAVFLGTHNLLYFHSFAFLIQVCFLRELPASPGLFSFLNTQTSSDSQRRISVMLRCHGEPG